MPSAFVSYSWDSDEHKRWARTQSRLMEYLAARDEFLEGAMAGEVEVV